MQHFMSPIVLAFRQENGIPGVKLMVVTFNKSRNTIYLTPGKK